MATRVGQVESLRPRSIGDLIDTTFRQYRSHFLFVLKVSTFLLLPFLILQSILNYQSESRTGSTIRQLVGNILQASRQHPLPQQPAPVTGAQLAGNLVAGLMVAIAYPLAYGVILHWIARASLSAESIRFGEGLGYAAKRWFSVVVTDIFMWIVIGVCISIGWGAAIVPIVILSSLKVSLAITIPLGILLVLGGLLLTLWLVTRVSMASSVVREEKRIFWPAMARAWVLTRRNFWRTLGYIVLMVLIVEVIQGAIVGVSSLLPPILSVILVGLGTLFLTPFQMLAMANLYVDLRVRTDGLDLREWLPGAGDHEELTEGDFRP